MSYNYDFEPLPVRKAIGKRPGRKGYSAEDFGAYGKYVEDIKCMIVESDLPLQAKIDFVDKLYIDAMYQVRRAGKRNYVPGPRAMEKKMARLSTYVDGLVTKAPKVSWARTSALLYDRLDEGDAEEFLRNVQGKVAFAQGDSITLLHPYALMDRESQEISFDDELVHVADRNSIYSIVSDAKNDLRVVADVNERIRRLGENGELGSGEVGREVIRKFDSVHKSLNRLATGLDFEYPMFALIEGVPLFLTEKLVDKEALRQNFEKYLRELKSSNEAYDRFKLLGYNALKIVEEKAPEKIKTLATMKNDRELFDLAGIDIGKTPMALYYKDWKL
jgi:hypothetical protein